MKQENMNNFHLAIISTHRSCNVEFMQKLCEPYRCTWYVNNGEYDSYKNAGAYAVFECGINICQARNMAISHAVDLPCIQISDDLKNIKRIWLENNKRFTEFVTVQYVCESLIENLSSLNIFYGGVAINNNQLNYTGKDIDINKLIVNDFICIMPGKQLLFDESVALKEDYDLSIEQILSGNGVLRLNNILCDFPHRQNKGGANEYRNETTENEATAALMRKWPRYVKPNPRRPGQILLDYAQIQKDKTSGRPMNLFDL